MLPTAPARLQTESQGVDNSVVKLVCLEHMNVLHIIALYCAVWQPGGV